MPAKLKILAVLPLVALAACGEDPAPQQNDGRSAAGEVLEGTISDAMLPLDELRSQPPLVAPSASGSASSSSSDDGDDAEAAPEEEPSGATAAEPAAAPANDGE